MLFSNGPPLFPKNAVPGMRFQGRESDGDRFYTPAARVRGMRPACGSGATATVASYCGAYAKQCFISQGEEFFMKRG